MQRRDFLSKLLQTGGLATAASVGADTSILEASPAPPSPLRVEGGFEPGRVYVLIYNAAKIGPGTLPGQPLHTVINKLAEDGVRISACLPAQWAEGDPVQDRPILTIVPVRSPTSADDPQPWREGLEVPAFYFSK